MVYRLFASGIVVFWVLMAALLVRTELFPDRDNRLPVPVDYVGRLVFRREQSSDLVLSYQRRRLDGNFHVQPKRVSAPGDGRAKPTNVLSVSGNFQLALPGAGNQRVVFHGGLELDDHEDIERVEISLSLHEPKQTTAGVTLHLEGRPAENQWHYQVTQGTVTLREGSGSPEAILDSLDLRNYGLDPRLISQAGAQAAAVSLTAHRGVLQVSDEEIETYVISIRQGDGPETSIHINQLGQILAVKTFLGYDLYDETLAP